MLNHEMVAEAMRHAMAAEHLPPEALHALQQRKLRELVRYAAAHSPFYARHYGGIDVESAALAELPPVTKRTVQAQFDEVVTDRRLTLAGVKLYCRMAAGGSSAAGPRPWHLGEFAVLMSSGTSGERGYYVLDGPALADAIATGYRQSERPARQQGAQGSPDAAPHSQTGARGREEGGGGAGAASAGTGAPAREPQRIAAVMLIEPFDSAGTLMRMIPESVGAKQLIDIRQDFALICQQLNAFRPSFLSSFPYMLRMLSAAAEDGRLRIRPRRITSSGDVLTESDRAYVKKAFGIEPLDYYCSTEAPYIAWECEAHEGLHVNADYVILESVDAENRPVPPGKLGDKTLITNLSNRAMPLVRYEMSDQVEFLEGACSCGSLLPRIRTVAGRVEHILSLPGALGRRVSLVPEHIDDFVGGLEGLANYQVIQQPGDRLAVNFIAERASNAREVEGSIVEALAACFAQYGVSPNVAIDVHRVEQLQPIRPGSTKVCHYWNRCA